jgi:hypothetical protein
MGADTSPHWRQPSTCARQMSRHTFLQPQEGDADAAFHQNRITLGGTSESMRHTKSSSHRAGPGVIGRLHSTRRELLSEFVGYVANYFYKHSRRSSISCDCSQRRNSISDKAAGSAAFISFSCIVIKSEQAHQQQDKLTPRETAVPRPVNIGWTNLFRNTPHDVVPPIGHALRSSSAPASSTSKDLVMYAVPV